MKNIKDELMPYPEVMDALKRIVSRAEHKSTFGSNRLTRKKNQAILEFHRSIIYYLDIHAKRNIQG
jgi:hypothetical protein